MTIAARKRIELQCKIASLQLELNDWRTHSQANQRLAKHYSQIRRLSNELDSVMTTIRARLDELHDESELLKQCWLFESMALEVHWLWGFFRNKFALRSVEWFSSYLSAVDELAWQCYKPARQAATALDTAASSKEPPLVFFSNERVPFTVPRGAPFEMGDIDTEEIGTGQLRQALHLTPIPVIGVPWLLAQHLPGALIIAHEVGHNVEADFDLSATLVSLVDESMSRARHPIEPARQSAWRAWIPEVFADIYAALAIGPAFVSTLVDLLATDKTLIETQRADKRDWGEYPTRYLRMLIGSRVLRVQGHDKESEAIEAGWRKTYTSHGMQDFERDVATIVDAILSGSYPQFGGLTLTQLISFGPAEQSRAMMEAKRLLNGFSPVTDKVRTLFAAAALAFVEDPEQYARANVQPRIVNRVAEIVGDGLTRGPADVPTPKDFEKLDREAADKLLALLSGITT
jgi:hypothetical protein